MEAKSVDEIAVDLIENVIVVGDCWECHLVPSLDRAGRRRHYVNVGGRNGRRMRATRLIYAAVNGPIPNGLWVLHTCDNSACIKPTHLFLGTAQDNTDDMIAKGRKKDDPEVGQRRRKATWNMIRPLLEQGLDRHAIAGRLGLSLSTVWNYLNGPYSDRRT